MKKATIILLTLFVSAHVIAQQVETQSLPGFSKIIVSPHISLVLIKGDKESIRLLCNNIDPKKVNIKVSGNKLRLYLDHARIIEKQVRTRENDHEWKQGIYHNVSVTAFVTYKQLKALEIRGESEISAEEVITTDKLKLRAFGEVEVNLAGLNTKKFKASLYGESKVKINTGLANRQVYRIFGEAKIDTKGLVCATAAVRMYGEGKLSLNATDEVYLTGFGEPKLAVTGTAIITKGLVIGQSAISRD